MLISTAGVVEVEYNARMCIKESSRMEIVSHVNMTVVVLHAYIVYNMGRVSYVSPFTPKYL